MAAIEISGIQVVVFDLDDTLYPERSYAFSGFEAVGRWLAEHHACGFSPAGRMRELFDTAHRPHVFDVVLQELGIEPSPERVQAMVKVYREHRPAIRLFPDAQEALRAVPNSLRQAGLALGATKWQTTWHHVLPVALPGIPTGTILAVSRAIGETAPLVVVGASTFIALDPSGPFSKFTTLPIQIYQWTSRPQAEFRNIAAAAILVLLAMLLALNATAVFLRNRYSVRM